MKRTIKSMVGVTLLEIMLVLAIAAMVIVMSIRYYQSASLNQKLNAAVDTVTGIIAAAESYLSANGTFSGLGGSSLNVYLPGGKLPNSPWGGTVGVTASGSSAFVINMNAPTAGCTQLLAILTKNNSKITGSACSAITVTE